MENKRPPIPIPGRYNIGIPGPAGRGIESITVEDSLWHIVYTDGTTQDIDPNPADLPELIALLESGIEQMAQDKAVITAAASAAAQAKQDAADAAETAELAQQAAQAGAAMRIRLRSTEHRQKPTQRQRSRHSRTRMPRSWKHRRPTLPHRPRPSSRKAMLHRPRPAWRQAGICIFTAKMNTCMPTSKTLTISTLLQKTKGCTSSFSESKARRETWAPN